jgi:hypothetical protein
MGRKEPRLKKKGGGISSGPEFLQEMRGGSAKASLLPPRAYAFRRAPFGRGRHRTAPTPPQPPTRPRFQAQPRVLLCTRHHKLFRWRIAQAGGSGGGRLARWDGTDRDALRVGGRRRLRASTLLRLFAWRFPSVLAAVGNTATLQLFSPPVHDEASAAPLRRSRCRRPPRYRLASSPTSIGL